jgi:type II restriction enzyme
MKIDLIELYNKDKNFSKVSSLLKQAKELHRKNFVGNDFEQSWRAFKGKNLEKLIEYIIRNGVENLGLKIINGNRLERTKNENLSEELAKVKRNLLIDYGEFGSHLPDIDIIIYNKNCRIIAILSINVTLRERIAQSGYWKLKLNADKTLSHIKYYFITPDEDGTLINKKPCKKGRAIIESDLDGSYVLSEVIIEESNKVKMFDKLIDDLKKVVEKDKKGEK